MCGSSGVAAPQSSDGGELAPKEAMKSTDAALRSTEDETGCDVREEFKRMMEFRGAERRVDPEDGQLRTFAELQACCAGEYSPSDVDKYWRERCRPTADLMGRALMRYIEEDEADTAYDSDGENVRFCKMCHLPIGNRAYQGDEGEGTFVHGECRAHLMQQAWGKEQETHSQKDANEKKVHRKRCDIGWSAKRIPRNVARASKFAGRSVPQGMCCLVLQQDSNSAHVAATIDPAASVNLEYLALALQVRFHTGGEPFFSLDPLDLQDARSVQVKRFEPAWLSETSLGEVLFQADYYLKELSMGEHSQPVVGMRSGFDFSEEESHSSDWTAREWFVVRKAGVHLSRNKVLIPYCKMGVEAREQVVVGDEGLQDVEITRPDHPLVKYAELFEHNFDLIAERKGAIYHLREAAKASILAKYLLESETNLEETWFEGPSALERALPLDPCQQKVPLLGNEREHSQIYIQDGNIIGAEKGYGSTMHGVYGGVQFGLEKFAGLTKLGKQYGFLPARSISVQMLPLRTPQIVVPPPPPAIAPPPPEAPPTEKAVTARSEPQGVDLNLDQFDLSASMDLADEFAGSDDCNWKPLEACVNVGESFWSNLHADVASTFKDDDKALFRAVFNPNITDRHDEGDQFVPPSTNSAYLQHLRTLVKEETSLLEKRKACFFSKDFAIDAPGAIFPSSWTPSLAIVRGQKSQDMASASSRMSLRPNKAEGAMLKPTLRSAAPTFDKSTEDGTRFRIYRINDSELRTTQELDGDEVVGVVFSVITPVSADSALPAGEKIVQIVQYVERNVQRVGNGMGQWPHYPRFYVVLRSEQGHAVVTEKLKDGTVTWNECPSNLEARNAFAKVVYTAECDNAKVTIGDMRSFQATEAENASWGASYSECKRYARVVCSHVARASVIQ